MIEQQNSEMTSGSGRAGRTGAMLQTRRSALALAAACTVLLASCGLASGVGAPYQGPRRQTSSARPSAQRCQMVSCVSARRESTRAAVQLSNFRTGDEATGGRETVSGARDQADVTRVRK